MKSRKKIISTMLCICLMLTALVSNIFGTTATASTGTKSVSLVQKDKNIVKVKGEYNGDILYGTLDRKTKEITLQAVESSSSSILSTTGSSILATARRNKTTNYKVNVHDFKKGQKTSADIVNVDTNEKYSINGSKVKAQAVFAVPLIEILGEAVIDELMADAALIIIGGVDYALASEMEDTVDDGDYQYYMAYLDYGTDDVYIGSGIDYNSAYNIVTENSTQNGVWADNQIDAFTLANDVGSYAIYDGKHSESEGYYEHYHASSYRHAHIWFF